MLICFIINAFIYNFFSIFVSGELETFKFNNATNECNIIDNEYCIHKPLKDDCTVTIISPFSCASQQNETSCDFFLDWSTINDDAAKFTLSKYNYKMDEWIAIIFSNSNISNTEVNSDIIITLLPSTSKARILNGIIKGSDVILVDDLQEIDSYNYSEKKLLSQKISFTKNYVDIEFSFKYTSENSINLNKCSKNNPSKGFYIFLMSGKLDDKFNILFETATIPKIFGPFCLKSCSKNLLYFNNIPSKNQNTVLKNQEKKQAISLRNKLSQATNIYTSTNFSSVDNNTILFDDLKYSNKSIIQTDDNSSINLTVANNSKMEFSTNLIEMSTVLTNTKESLEIISSEGDVLTTTKSESTNLQTKENTNASVVFQDPTELVITSTSTTLSSSSLNFCSDQVQNLSNIDLTYIYDHRVKYLNYTLTVHFNLSFIRIGVFNINPYNKKETFLVIAETNETISKSYTNKNESETISSSVDNNKIIFRIPRELELTNNVSMEDCQYFSFYIGNDSEISAMEFISHPNENSVFLSKIELLCLEKCPHIERKKVDINLKFNVNNYLYHLDLDNSNSEKSKNLSMNIIEIFKTILNDKFDSFKIINILKANNKKSSFKRQIMADFIIIESILTVWSDNSQKFTQNNVLKILRENSSFSHLYQISGFTLIETFSEKTSTSIQTTTLKPYDTEYSKIFALALVFSLLVTVIVLGGALFAYHRWQKSKPCGTNRLRLAVPNRRIDFEGQMVNLDSSQENKFTSEGLDLEFVNPAFEENSKENTNLNFTDFTGSREVGIDIGTLEENSLKQPVIMEEINEKEDDFKNLRNILNECLKPEIKNSSGFFKNHEIQTPNLYRTGKCENLKTENDEINFDYFDEYKRNPTDSETLKYSSESEINEEKNAITPKNKDLDSFDEKTEEVANIFSKDIEKNLPELFGEYLEEEAAKKKQKKIQLDQESIESAAKDSLNISTDEHSEEEDFKPIHKNAFKNFRVESNNKFIIDENKSSFKELFKQKSENDEKNQKRPNNELMDKSNKVGILKHISGGIAEFSTPRVCVLKTHSKSVELGLHFSDNKNNMILDIDKNSPAELAGIKPGDKILFIGSVNVEKSTCEDVKNKIIQARLNSSNDEITLVVMNAIEYNISKSNETLLIKKELDSDKYVLKTKSNSQDSIDAVKSQNETEFNPFDDIPNEMITPFLHYSSIPPPDTFQINDEDNIRNDSLEVSTSETVSSCIDINKKKETTQNNLNDFDFISNFTSTTDIYNETNSNPSNFIFPESSQFQTRWSIKSSHSEKNETTTKAISDQDKKEFG